MFEMKCTKLPRIVKPMIRVYEHVVNCIELNFVGQTVGTQRVIKRN